MRRLSTAENWPVTPIAARTASASVCRIVTGDPHLAVVGADQRGQDFTMVVFPAPLGPSKAKIDPSGTWRSMPSSTTLSP